MKNSYHLSQKIIALFVSLSFLSSALAQCPYDIGEIRTLDGVNSLIHLEFEGNFENKSLAQFAFVPKNISFEESICGTGAYFNGESSFIRVEPTLKFDDDFTITSWIKVIDQEGPMGIFSIREQCETNYRGFSMAQFNINEYQTEGLNYQVNKHSNCSGWSGGDRYINEDLLVQNDEFIFVAVTVDGNSKETREVNLFANCDQFETSMKLDFDTGSAFDPARYYVSSIGASSVIDPFINSFYGIIDEFRIFDKVLDYEEIKLLFRQCKPISISIDHIQECGYGSSIVTIKNTEKEVNYQLFNLSRNEYWGLPEEGNCGELSFSITHEEEVEFYQIQAQNTISNCSIFLDTIFSTLALVDTVFTVDSVIVCEGDSLYLEDLNNQSYSLFDTLPGIDGCDTIKETKIRMLEEPYIYLGEDRTFCYGDSVKFSQEADNMTIIWNDAFSSNEFIVDKPQILFAKAINPCGEYYDQINVDFEDCCQLFIPNVFSPNNDGYNDVFKYFLSDSSCENIKDFRIKIYDRWGELVFESNDIYDFWDGKIDDRQASVGIFVYTIEYKIGVQIKKLSGDITLLR